MINNNDAIIKTVNLSYVYGKDTTFQKTAVNNVNIEIKKGDFLGVIGHTGSGKSTLIQHLNGLLKPSVGKIYIDGEDIWEKPREIRKFRFKVGLVFQYPEYQLFEETVFKDIAFGPANMGLSKDEIDARVLWAAKIVGLKDKHLKKSPFELSGGQKRRVAIAGVIAMQPNVLILDEPTAGLDPKGRDIILNEIKNYHESNKDHTVILVSHSMEDIAKYSKNVVVMNKAEVFLYDTVNKVFSHSENLAKIGLDIPQITQICTKLYNMGYKIKPMTYTLEGAKKQILDILADKEK